MTIDIKDFYLNTPMGGYEYMRIKITDIPNDIIHQYNLQTKVTKDGYVYVEVRKGMYGLPQDGILSPKLPETRLNKAGYFQIQLTTRFWNHKWWPISFTLCVDDLGVKYVRQEHDQYLMNTLKQEWKISQDWEGKRYLGLDLDWDYAQRRVHISMLEYNTNNLKWLHHIAPNKL